MSDIEVHNKGSVISRNKDYITSLGIYIVISLVMFWNLAINIAGSVVNGGGDAFQSLWGLWWVPHAIFALHQSPYVTDYILYPVGANLITQTMSPLAGILTVPFQLISIPFAYNLLFFASFALGGLFMYMLAKYLVKNKYAAFIAGLIFAFSPMHIAQAYSHLQWTSIEFIPLFVLFFIMAIREKEKTKIYAALAGVSFVLLTFVGDIEQGIMVLFFALVALVLLAIIEKKEVINVKTLTSLCIMGVVALLLSAPFLLMISSNLSSGALNSTGQLNDIPHNMLYSATIASMLLPSYYNGIFHGLSLGYVNQTYGLTYQGLQYAPDITEKVAYIGFSVLILALIGIFYEHKKDKKKALFWTAMLVIFLLMALGPIIQLSGSSGGSVPSIYLIYKYIPILNIVREPGRFDVMATLALAILAALGINHLFEKQHDHKKLLYYTAAIAIIILIEYNGMPLSSSFANSLVRNATIPSSYGLLSKVQGNFSTLSLPGLPNQNGSFLYPGMAMYYATATNKPLVGGYPTRVNATQQQLLENVPLLVSAGYLQNGYGLVFPYPINENYTQLTLLWLAEYNVGFISVINNAYTPNENGVLQNYLESFLGPPTYQDSGSTIFSTSSAESQNAGKELVSYVVGTWAPGYSFCQSSAGCNQTFGSMWWGSNLRAVTVLSPESGNLSMSLDGLSYYNSASVSVVLNGNPIGTLNVTNSVAKRQTETFTFPVSAGFNQIIFYEQNQTLYNQNPNFEQYPYFNYGITNMSFSLSK